MAKTQTVALVRTGTGQFSRAITQPKTKYRTRLVPAARKVGAFARSQASAERDNLTAMGGALLLGLAKRNKMKLPTVAGFNGTTTVALGAWVAGKFTKNRFIKAAATGMLCAAIFEAAQQSAVGSAADVLDESTDGDISGDVDID